MTTLIATLGTEPIAIHHFHRIVLYSPLANVLADPLNAFVIMPWALLACLLMPFGLEHVGLVPMGWGIDATIWIARWVSSLPGAVQPAPPLPMFGVVLIVLGGLWLCLWQQRWRLWGLAGIVAGFATMLVVAAARHRARRFRPAPGGARRRRQLSRRARRGKAEPVLPGEPDRGAAAAVARRGERRRRPARLPERRPLFLRRQRPPGGAGPDRGGAAGGLRLGRRDRRASAGRVRLPRQDPGRRPHRQLAPRGDRAVAGQGRGRHRERQRAAAATGRGCRTRYRRRSAPRLRARPLKPEDRQTRRTEPLSSLRYTSVEPAPGNVLDEEVVLSFVRSAIKSAWSLELLLLLYRDPLQSWTGEALVRELRGSEHLVSEASRSSAPPG